MQIQRSWRNQKNKIIIVMAYFRIKHDKIFPQYPLLLRAPAKYQNILMILCHSDRA